MNRRVFVIFTLLASLPASMAVLAQTPGQPQIQSKCTLTESQSPAIRGIRLGMNAEVVLSLFPGSSQRPENKNAIERAQGYPSYGVAYLYFQPSSYPTDVKDRFAGISSIYVSLFDGRVTELRVEYAGPPAGPTWRNVDEFIAKLSEAFELPSSKDWLQVNQSKILNCNGLEIVASTRNQRGSISLRNNAYIHTVRERAATDEERRRSEFKP